MGKDGGMAHLTLEQQKAIEDTWSLVYADAGKHGLELMLRIFKEIPHAQGYFDKFRNKHEKDLQHSDALHYHAEKMMSGMNTLISNIGDKINLVNEVRALAADHKTRGVTPTDFKMALTILQQLLKEKLTDVYCEQTECAWKACCDLIIEAVEQEMSLRLNNI